MWLIESEWTPHEVQAHLTFLVDPIDLKVVWAIGASISIPKTRDEASSVSSISLRHQWKNELEPFLNDLDQIRKSLSSDLNQ
jgi:hypothetical protein